MGIFKDSRAFVLQTRRGDRAMCMRFWGENTRETQGAIHQRLLTRAFHPKARSHDPITTPGVVGEMNQAATAVTAASGVRWVSDAAWTWGFAKSR
uniref:hypothetical protein n=1 Tax=Rhodoferax sp. TaxID=50421 RepID=UPI00374D1F12